MRKSLIIGLSITGGICTTIAVPPIVIAATEVPIAKQLYNDAMDYFFEICKIPHVSNETGHTDSLVKIKNYIKDVAKKRLGTNAVHSDKAGNVWVDIEPSPGCKKYKKIILQGHMDMVWACAPEVSDWDRWTHPVSEPVIEEIDGVETIHSKDWLTNLGLDNGTAVALMLSVIKNNKDFYHGPIRCIFTANEENGFPGSESLGKMEDGSEINVISHDEGYDYLLNLDTGPIGDVVFNSGGGYFNTVTGSNYETAPHTGATQYTVRIYDGQGGHSGVDIGKGYGNPIGLVCQALKTADTDIQLESFTAPRSTDTSIPTEAIATFYSYTSSIDELKQKIEPWFAKAKRQKYAHDINLKLEIQSQEVVDTHRSFQSETSKKIIDFVSSLEFGALERYIEPDERDAVRVSGNIGQMEITIDQTTKENKFMLVYGNRFQEISYFKQYYETDYDEQFAAFAQSLPTGTTSTPSDWSSWEGDKNGKLASLCTNAYKKIKVPTKKVRCHGGLECADFKQFNDWLDIISTGSTVYMEHNVKESMPLDSYRQLIKMLLNVFSKMEF